jgi:hypothetical protein
VTSITDGFTPAMHNEAITTAQIGVTVMKHCTHCWSRYMDTMQMSRCARDPKVRKTLVLEAYTWLHRYFEAEDREMARREGLVTR